MSISTNAINTALRAATQNVQERLVSAGKSVSTGRRDDPMGTLPTAVLPDLAGARRTQREAESAVAALGIAADRANVTATTVGAIRESLGEIPERLLNQPIFGTSAAEAVTQDVNNALDGAIARLNTRVAGRNLFAGVATDRTALAATENFTQIARDAFTDARANGATAADAATAAMDAVRGGFDDGQLYRGATTGAISVQARGLSISYAARADEAAFQDTIAALAVASVAGELPDAERREALTATGMALRGAREDLIGVEARVGAAQASIAQAQSEGEAKLSDSARRLNALEGVDPFEAATELEALRIQLETIYSVTGRIAGLSLAGRL